MTHYLYAIPSFWGGAARALDLGSTLTVYNESSTGSEASMGHQGRLDGCGEGYAKRDRRFHRKTCRARKVSKIYPHPSRKVSWYTSVRSNLLFPVRSPLPKYFRNMTKFTLEPQK